MNFAPSDIMWYVCIPFLILIGFLMCVVVIQHKIIRDLKKM